jgi:hypothetical protein
MSAKVLTLPGTKRETRWRRIPFGLFPKLEELLHCLVAERPDDPLLLPGWTNIRRDLADACDKAGIGRVSPNDLRRTFGSWLKNKGIDSAVVARLMGHTSTRMVDRVYGRINDGTLAAALGRLQAIHDTGTEAGESQGAGGSTNGSSTLATEAPDATSETTSPSKVARSSVASQAPKSLTSPRKTKPSPTYEGEGFVPRDRIELPTRGFSVRTGQSGKAGNVIRLEVTKPRTSTRTSTKRRRQNR